MGRLTDDQKALRNDPEWLEAQAWGIGYSREAALEEAARLDGMALGYAFRAAELRYDARDGMTAATERRRFEPGARWAQHGRALVVLRDSYAFGLPWVHFQHQTQATELGEITRENGWRFLGLPGGYR